MSFIDNTTPALNDSGQVAFKVLSLDATTDSAIWLGDSSRHEIVYRLPEEKLISDVSLNNRGQIAFHQFDDVRSDGIFLIDGRNREARVLIPVPASEPVLFSSPALNDRGLALTTVRAAGGAQSVLFSDQRQVTAEPLGVSYFFSPALNAQGAWAAKVRLGAPGDWDESQPDEIWYWDPLGGKKVLAQDHDSAASSPYRSFHNGVALSDDGAAIFFAVLLNGKNALVLAENGSSRILLQEGEQGIQELERFNPRINSRHEIAFRAVDESGRHAIFFGDGIQWQRLIGEGDFVDTDLGRARILLRPGFPGLSGDISLNSQAQIAFHALLSSEDGGKEWGEGIFLLQGRR